MAARRSRASAAAQRTRRHHADARVRVSVNGGSSRAAIWPFADTAVSRATMRKHIGRAPAGITIPAHTRTTVFPSLFTSTPSSEPTWRPRDGHRHLRRDAAAVAHDLRADDRPHVRDLHVRPSVSPPCPVTRRDSEMLHAARSTLALDTEYRCSGPRRWYMTLSFPRGEGRLLFRKARFGLVHVSRRRPSRS